MSDTESNQPTPTVDAKFLDDLKLAALRQAESSFNQKIKEATGLESLDAFIEAKKLDEEKSLKERGEYQKLADTKIAEAQLWRERYNESLATQSILHSCLENNVIDSQAVLALVKPNISVSDKGEVSISGKSVDEAIKEMLKSKTYLVKPMRTGSSSPSYPDVPDANKKREKEIEDAKKSGSPLQILKALRTQSN